MSDEAMKWDRATCQYCGFFKSTHTELISVAEAQSGSVPSVAGSCRKYRSDETNGDDFACPSFVDSSVRYTCNVCGLSEPFRRNDHQKWSKYNGWKFVDGGWRCEECFTDKSAIAENDINETDQKGDTQ